MAIHIRTVLSPKELTHIRAVRGRARAIRMLLPTSPPTPQLEPVDQLETTRHLLAYDEQEPIACLRMVAVSQGELPSRTLESFRHIRSQLRGVTYLLDACELLPAWQGREGIMVAILKTAIQLLRARSCEHLLAMVGVELLPTFQQAGFYTVGAPVTLGGQGRQLMSLYADMADFVPPFLEWTHTPWFDTLGEHLQRSIYAPGELVFLQGDYGDTAYLVVRGSMCVTSRGGDGREVLLDILPPGSIFGELALLDEGARSATVRAYAQECDVVVMDRAFFRAHILGHPARCEAILRLMAQRLRGSAARVAALQPWDVAPLLVEVLSDASRSAHLSDHGLLPFVTYEWLAGKVGRPPSLIKELLSTLERNGLVSMSSEGLVVHSLSGLSSCVEAMRQQHAGQPQVARRPPAKGPRVTGVPRAPLGEDGELAS
ncbi:MAG: cyclic nucleotide-binding domain-containing protein [Myxococcota bacterium]